jgi:hypothetical protein
MALKSILDLPDREIISCLSGVKLYKFCLRKGFVNNLSDAALWMVEFVEIIKSHPDTVFIPTNCHCKMSL